MKSLWLIGFEQEIIIGDDQRRPVNYIQDWTKQRITSELIMTLLQNSPRYHKIIQKSWNIAKPELDASQIELYNPLPQTGISQLQEELAETFLLVENIVSWLWLHILPVVVPNDDFEPIHSRAVDRYAVIHEKLMSLWEEVRKATNIAWTHITYFAWVHMDNHIWVSQLIKRKLLAKEYTHLHADPERIKRYEMVVGGLQRLGFVEAGSLQDIQSEEDVHRLQMKDGEDIFSYELVRKKRGLDSAGHLIHLSECRIVDGPVSYEDVYQKTNAAYHLVLEGAGL